MLAMAIFYGYWVLRTNHYVFTTVRLSWNVDLFLDPLYITCTYQVEVKKKLKQNKVEEKKYSNGIELKLSGS